MEFKSGDLQLFKLPSDLRNTWKNWDSNNPLSTSKDRVVDDYPSKKGKNDLMGAAASASPNLAGVTQEAIDELAKYALKNGSNGQGTLISNGTLAGPTRDDILYIQGQTCVPISEDSQECPPADPSSNITIPASITYPHIPQYGKVPE